GVSSLALRGAGRQIRDDDAISAVFAVNKCEIPHLIHPASLAIACATPGDSMRWRGTIMRPFRLGCLNTSCLPPPRLSHPSRVSRAMIFVRSVSSPPTMRKYMRNGTIGQALLSHFDAHLSHHRL